jgi:hypothetical protein
MYVVSFVLRLIGGYSGGKIAERRKRPRPVMQETA